MNVYIYHASLYCESCGQTMRTQLDQQGKTPENPSDESSFDSDDYPKGPFPNGGGESDAPSHCYGCDTFLENPLTSDGEKYVLRTVSASNGSPMLDNWRSFYSFLFEV